jgi:hypothetical protein
MAKLTKTPTPGIFRRHPKGCAGGRCDCSHVFVWRHRGKQEAETFRTYAESREAKGSRGAKCSGTLGARSHRPVDATWGARWGW